MSAKAIREYDGKRMLANWFARNSSIKLSDQFAQINKENTIEAASNTNGWIKDGSVKLVAKPDQLIKRRGKSGLLLLRTDMNQAKEWIEKTAQKEVEVEGVRGVVDHFIVEPFVEHQQSDEYYLCLQSIREGTMVMFYHEGGIDVGDVDSKAERMLVEVDETASIDTIKSKLLSHVPADRKDLLATFISDIYKFYTSYFYTYLEINPLVVKDGKVYPLDMAAKVDQTAEYECGEKWGKLSFPAPFGRQQTAEELYISELDAKTGASLKLTVLNPKGRIWTMVAGGGASVVYADTISDLGFGKELANYGEYSGDPSEALTYEYAKTVLKLLTNDIHPEGKILIIAGGIANFTNVAETFKGIVRAITEYANKLISGNVNIFVRRGGPNYQEGLQMMAECGSSCGIPIQVYGPETHITSVVSYALGLKAPPVEQQGADKLETGGSDTPQIPGTPAAVKNVAYSSSTPDASRKRTSSKEDVQEPKENYNLFTNASVACVYGMQPKAVQNMLDFDHCCGRKKPSIVAMIYPFGGNHFQKFYWGATELLIPVYQKMGECMQRHQEIEVMINFASFRSVYSSVTEAFAFPHIKTIAIIAEGVPENYTKSLIKKAKQKGVTIIGPATVGGIKPGSFRIGNTGGMIDNIIASKLYRPGSVAYVSRSGGMSNELNNIISRNSDGVYEGIAIGGDRYPGTTFIDHILRYEANPAVKIIVLLGEVGGVDEYEICEAIKNKKITKPLIGWCLGTCAKMFAYEVQFGHAGALARGQLETADAKNKAMKDAGAVVPDSFEEFGATINKVYKQLVKDGTIIEKPEPETPTIPMDYSWAQKLGLIRKPTSFISTISDERGDELMYAGVPISMVFKEELGIGGVISLLWFKRRLPAYAAKFIEMVLITTADHGPAVAGAHNTIVTTRAGKDLIDSLVTGLLTIGPRFGGAIDGAAEQFSWAYDTNKSPKEFVAEMRKLNKLIMGIGHRVKTVENTDKRVAILRDYALKEFPSAPVLKYALEVEKVTTSKKPNLILNVDGCVGTAFVDLLRGCGAFSREEADSYIKHGCLNGLFVLGRSIGLIGHHLDQKRLKQPLYRHPWDDISYAEMDTTFI